MLFTTSLRATALLTLAQFGHASINDTATYLQNATFQYSAPSNLSLGSTSATSSASSTSSTIQYSSTSTADGTSSSSSSPGLGDYIRSGLGLGASSSTSGTITYTDTTATASTVVSISAISASSAESISTISRNSSATIPYGTSSNSGAPYPIGASNNATAASDTNVTSTAYVTVQSTVQSTVVQNANATLHANATLNATITPSPSSTIVTFSANWTVPATGNGSAYLTECAAEWQYYSSIVGVPYGRNIERLSTAIPYNGTSYVTDFSASTTTLCDGHARIIGNLTPIAYSPTLTELYNTYYWTAQPPTCSIGQSDCSSAQRSFASAYSYWASYNVTASEPSAPKCTVTGAAATQSYCGPCQIQGGVVQLLYFPVTTKYSRNMCATTPGPSTACPFGSTDSGVTVTNGIGQAMAPCPYYQFNATSTQDSGPYVVTNGNTFYENKAYLSYADVYATNGCGTVGKAYSGGVIPVASSNIYSMSGYHYELFNYAWQMNFADLNDPIPFSAYDCMYNCAESGNVASELVDNLLNGQPVEDGLCADPKYIMWDPEYAPQLAVPPELKALDPEWAGCLLGLDGLWDPPVALQPASSAATPTAPSTPTPYTTSASPAQTPVSPAATTTAPRSSSPAAESVVQGSSASASHSQAGAATPSSEAGGNSPAPYTSSSAGANAGGGVVSIIHSASSQPTSAEGGNAASSTVGGASGSGGAGGSSAAGGNDQPSQGGSGQGQTTSKNPGAVVVSVIQGASTAATQPASAAGGNAASSAVGGGSGGSTAAGGSDPSQGGSGGSQTTSKDPGGVLVSVIQGASTAATQPASAAGSGVPGSADPGSSNGGSSPTSGASGPDRVVPNNSAGGATSVVVVGASTFTVASAASSAGGSAAVVVAAGGSTATLAAGQATMIGGHTVSAPSSGGAVFGSGSGATTVSPGNSGNSADGGSGASVVSVGSSAFTVMYTQAAGSSAVVIAKGGSLATLTPGQVTTIGGQVVSAPSSGGAVIGTGSSAATVHPGLSNSAGSSDPGAIATVGGQTISVDPANSGNVIIGGQTLTPGKSTLLNGTPVYVTSGAILVGGSNGQPTSTIAISAPKPSTGNVLGNANTVLTISGHTLTASADPSDPSVVVVDGSSLSLGGSGATINGVSLSLAPSGLLAGGSVVIPASPTALGTFTANGATITVEQLPGNSQTLLVEGASTATLGSDGVATLASHTLSLGSSAGSSFVVVDGSSTVAVGAASAGASGTGLSTGSSASGTGTRTAASVPGTSGGVQAATASGKTASGGGRFALISERLTIGFGMCWMGVIMGVLI
ncbi:hypothetical protein LTS01_014448 [Friedmanniomyces endolithicus]|nr:hypothetical protein LTS01_014448 [Friedmanniomyces endolithicus]